MCQLFETIKCRDGELYNLKFHQARFEKAQNEYFGISPHANLFKEIEIPEFAKTGLFRCRVTYSKQIEKIEFIPHRYREIKSLKLMEENKIDYTFKYTDRENLQKLFELRGNCDDIIIVKNGNITDSFAANIVLFDGNKWLTPDTPLLPGTQRAKLLTERIIFEEKIKVNDLGNFEKIGLINALNNLQEMPVIEFANIFF